MLKVNFSNILNSVKSVVSKGTQEVSQFLSNGSKLKPQLTEDVYTKPKRLISGIVQDRHIDRAAEQIKKMEILDVARSFNNLLIDGIDDWNVGVFPKYKLTEDGIVKEKGGELTRQLFARYAKALDAKPKKDVKRFVNLVLPKSKLEVLRKSADGNDAIKNFMEVLERKTGKVNLGLQ